MTARAFVIEAELALDEGTDPAAAGAAVTAELCGHWEHEGPCRWPHNNEILDDHEAARFRTLVVAADDDQAEIESRIESALRGGTGWRVLSVRSRDVAPDERALAGRLLAGPRATR